MKQGEIMLLDDNGNMTAKDGDKVVYTRCIRCGKHVLAKEVYRISQKVVCPHCYEPIKVQVFKNSVRVSIR